MLDEERALTQLLQRSAPQFEPLDGEAVRAHSAPHHNHRARRVGLPSAVAASVVAIAVAVSLLSRPTAPTPDAARPPATSTQVDNRSRTTDGVFRVELVLPATTFPADGQPIHAQIVVTNDTGRGVVIKNACNGWVRAGLSGGPVTFGITSGLVGCASKTIAPGTTRIETTIPTTFTQCQQGKRLGTADMPHCLGPNDSTFPNLPAGTYRAEVKTHSTSIAPVLSNSQTVTLTPPQ